MLTLPACGPEPDGGNGAAQQADLGAGEAADDDLPSAKYRIRRVDADVSVPDPSADFWQGAATTSLALMAQPLLAPRPELTTTDSVELAALHDGKSVAFRLRWKDAERSEAGALAQFSDAVALQFPFGPYEQTSVFMGSSELPVHIFHWRAQYQRDAERGKPEMRDIYPNIAIDMYPMEFRDAPGGTPEQREAFSPGTVSGNPQAYAKSGLDEIVAEGFATSAVQENTGGQARGEWKDGYWTVVITRPMESEGGSTLRDPVHCALAVAVWQGGKSEVGSRKCLTMAWNPFEVLP